MNKYPVLFRISMIARVVAWIALCSAGLMSLVVFIKMPGPISWTSRTSYGANSLDLYLGTGLLAGGGILLVESLILIMMCIMVRILIDIDHHPFASARTVLSSVDSTPAETAAASVQKDRRETRLANSETFSIDDTLSIRSGEFPAIKVGERIISLGKKQADAICARDVCVVFTKDGRVELLPDYLAERE